MQGATGAIKTSPALEAIFSIVDLVYHCLPNSNINTFSKQDREIIQRINSLLIAVMREFDFSRKFFGGTADGRWRQWRDTALPPVQDGRRAFDRVVDGGSANARLRYPALLNEPRRARTEIPCAPGNADATCATLNGYRGIRGARTLGTYPERVSAGDRRVGVGDARSTVDRRGSTCQYLTRTKCVTRGVCAREREDGYPLANKILPRALSFVWDFF